MQNDLFYYNQPKGETFRPKGDKPKGENKNTVNLTGVNIGA